MMRVFFDPRQLGHAPARELHNGGFVDHAEKPSRAATILSALGGAEAPADQGAAPLLRVHDSDYVAFLREGFAAWQAAGREGDAFPYVFPIVGRRPLDLERIDARIGRYSYDGGTPLTPYAWEASYWSCQSGLAALDAALGGDRAAFALSRPPGHHSGADYMGGYCYLNQAAVAAQAARDRGVARVAILDIDYHHGNGTQDIFWERGDVFFASLHADPATDYPFYWGHAGERGAGAGEGATLNLPLPRGTARDAYRRALGQALEAIARFGAQLLVVSFGADTYAQDPISHFAIETRDYPLLGRDIAAAGLPSVIVMEGGYAVDALGANVAVFLSGF
jgi:acetoin utilization deacetylase AcuC-like enzyme